MHAERIEHDAQRAGELDARGWWLAFTEGACVP
jgi:hypothetical protein